MASCPLCHSNINKPFYINDNATFYKCGVCSLLSKSAQDFPSPTEEKERYLYHNNNPSDNGYQEFVSPIIKAIERDFSKESKGLDFGAGTGPVVSKLLSEKGFSVTLYDAFFYPNEAALNTRYDYIFCCEVIEHFHSPNEEFSLLKNLLKPNGKLYCMTSIYDSSINFENWYYKNDVTHVVFYTETTLNWIQKKFDYSSVEIKDRLIVFST